MAATPAVARATAYDVDKIRADFPILRERVHGKPLAYLDNAASAQKPRQVIEAESAVYEKTYANVHRGVHLMSMKATDAYEGARVKIQRFLNAASPKEIVITRGTTEGINLVAQSWGRKNVGPGDEVLISAMEHHSNIVPWQMLCAEKGARLRVIPMDDAGDLLLDELPGLLNDRTKIVAVSHVSNALGTINDVRRIVAAAKTRGIPVLLDGAQAVPHVAVDVRELGCDFYVLSSHKLYGPSGVGVLWAKEAILEAMPPWQGGGDMILSVTFDKTTYNELPYKFEAGTPSIAGVVGFGAALDYVTAIGLDHIAAWEAGLLASCTTRLSEIEGVRLVGTARHKAAVVSFVMDGIHPHDIGTVLDYEGVAVRTGHHCAQPVMERLCIPATARASFGIYNTEAEIDALVAGLRKVREVFA